MIFGRVLATISIDNDKKCKHLAINSRLQILTKEKINVNTHTHTHTETHLLAEYPRHSGTNKQNYSRASGSWERKKKVQK